MSVMRASIDNITTTAMMEAKRKPGQDQRLGHETGDLVHVVAEAADRLARRAGHRPRPRALEDVLEQVLAQQRGDVVLEGEIDGDVAKDGRHPHDRRHHQQDDQPAHPQAHRRIAGQGVEKAVGDPADNLGKYTKEQGLENAEGQVQPRAEPDQVQHILPRLEPDALCSGPGRREIEMPSCQGSHQHLLQAGLQQTVEPRRRIAGQGSPVAMLADAAVFQDHDLVGPLHGPQTGGR